MEGRPANVRQEKQKASKLDSISIQPKNETTGFIFFFILICPTESLFLFEMWNGRVMNGSGKPNLLLPFLKFKLGNI
jgi:hypothetical protein